MTAPKPERNRRFAVLAMVSAAVIVLAVSAGGAWWWLSQPAAIEPMDKLAKGKQDDDRNPLGKKQDDIPDDAPEREDERPELYDLVAAPNSGSKDKGSVNVFTLKQPLAPPVEPEVPAAAIELPQPRVEIDLPSQVSDMIPAVGGRLLVLPAFRQNKIYLVDLQQQKVVKTLERKNHVLVAAGLDKLIIYDPTTREIERWSLATFEKEATSPFDFPDQIVAVGMGAASRGPMLVLLRGRKSSPYDSAKAVLVDIQAMKPLEVDFAAQRVEFRGDKIRASTDGSAFSVFGGNNDGTVLVQLGGDRVVATGLYGRWNLPGHDGRHVFTDHAVLRDGERTLSTRGSSVPAIQGDLFTSYRGWAMPAPPGGGRDGLAKVPVHHVGASAPVLFLDEIEYPSENDLMDSKDGSRPIPVAIDRRVQLMPDLQVAAHIDLPQTKVVLHRFDWRERLKASKLDPFLVLSTPPRFGAKGKRFEYQVEAVSSRGGAKLALELGPPGMKLSTTGRVQWDVPADFAARSAAATVSVRDSTGRTINHPFEVEVVAEWPSWARAPAALPADQGVFAEARKDEPSAPNRETPRCHPAKFEGDKVVVDLPSTPYWAIPAGNGRYLLVHLANVGKLVQFDVCEAKVVREIALPEYASFAAGAEKLLVLLPGSGMLLRYDLQTGKREKAATSPVPKDCQVLAMGHASKGPLLMSDGIDDYFVDPDSFRIYRYPNTNAERRSFGMGRHEASADGRVFTSWSGHLGSAWARSTVLSGRNATTFTSHEMPYRDLYPSVDGNWLRTGAGSLFKDGRYVGKSPEFLDLANAEVPALQGAYFIKTVEHEKKFRLHLGADARPLAQLPPAIPARARGLVRTFFNPEAQVVVQVERNPKGAVPDDPLNKSDVNRAPDNTGRIVLHRFDPDKAVADAGTNYLVVVSAPPTSVRQGRTFNYPIEAKSLKGNIEYRLERGPEGMAVDAAGKVTWKAPRDFDRPEVEVAIQLKDASGLETSHAFQLAILGHDGKKIEAKQ